VATTKEADMATDTTSVQTVVVGGGQAGLVMGYYLRRAGADFRILEGDPRVGDSWRRRYDSLRLFSPPRYASLPGWRIAPAGPFPTRDEMADYLEAYAARFELPVRTGTTVRRVSRADGGGFLVETSNGTYAAEQVVVTTGMHQVARVPVLASRLAPELRQLTSLAYRNPDQFAPGGVLVVGAGNSGTDIALDAAAAGHPTWIAGRHPGQVPFDIDSPAARAGVPLVMFAFRHVLTLRTPMGRRRQAVQAGHGVNLVRNTLADLEAAGITRIGRVESVVDGQPVSADGVRPDVATVVWSVGSDPDFSFLDLPIGYGEDGLPRHDRGVAEEPGLFFLGLAFQFALASETIQGLARDARWVVRQMHRRGSVYQPGPSPAPRPMTLAAAQPRPTPEDSR
jgi:putative flavoprotein involved in K+ transport